MTALKDIFRKERKASIPTDTQWALQAKLYQEYLKAGKGNKAVCYKCGGTIRNWWSI